MAFVSLKPWEERSGDENSAEAVIHRAKMELGKILVMVSSFHSTCQPLLNWARQRVSTLS